MNLSHNGLIHILCALVILMYANFFVILDILFDIWRWNLLDIQYWIFSLIFKNLFLFKTLCVVSEDEHFLRSIPTTLSWFYITFVTITKHQKLIYYYSHYQNGSPNIKLGWNWSSNDLMLIAWTWTVYLCWSKMITDVKVLTSQAGGLWFDSLLDFKWFRIFLSRVGTMHWMNYRFSVNFSLVQTFLFYVFGSFLVIIQCRDLEWK